MPTPDFIVELRRHIGGAPLWLTGANAMVVRDGRLLLVRRADSGEWTPVSGILDPGEHPAEAAVRETLEETGVTVEIERLLWVVVMDPVTYPNGDQCRFLDHGFLCRWVAGEPRVGDDESTEVGWFPLDDLPHPRHPRLAEMVAAVVADRPEVLFAL